MDDDAEHSEPLFRPEDLERCLNETPKPLVMNIEPLRLCAEQDTLLANEAIRIVEKTIAHVRAILPTMPIGRHLRLVTIRGLPGSFAIQSQHTPWGRGAGKIYQSIRNCIAHALTEEGMPAEHVPDDIMEPEAPQDPASLLSVDIIVEDDDESAVTIVDPDDEDVQLSFDERSLFHIYGTKWREWKKEG